MRSDTCLEVLLQATSVWETTSHSSPFFILFETRDLHSMVTLLEKSGVVKMNEGEWVFIDSSPDTEGSILSSNPLDFSTYFPI